MADFWLRREAADFSLHLNANRNGQRRVYRPERVRQEFRGSPLRFHLVRKIAERIVLAVC
jgi:hypothetical protein